MRPGGLGAGVGGGGGRGAVVTEVRSLSLRDGSGVG